MRLILVVIFSLVSLIGTARAESNCDNLLPYMFNVFEHRDQDSIAKSFYNSVCRSEEVRGSLEGAYSFISGNASYKRVIEECTVRTDENKFISENKSTVFELSTKVADLWRDCTYNPSRPGLYVTIFQQPLITQFTLHIVYTPLDPSDNEPIALSDGENGMTLSADFDGYSVQPEWHRATFGERLIYPRQPRNIHVTLPAHKREGKVEFRLRFNKRGDQNKMIPIQGIPTGRIARPQLSP